MDKKITILLLGALNLFSEDLNKEVKLDEISVTVQRSEQNLDEISRSVSVVDSKNLEKTMSSSIASALADEPGVTQSPNGMLGGQMIVRGFNSNSLKVPLTVNGDRFRGRSVLEYVMYDPTQIERVEIIRGPASALYGTDAFGGVINIVTKKASGDVYGDFDFTDTYLSSQFQSVNKGFNNRLQLGWVGHGYDFLLGLNYKFAGDYNTPEGDIPNSDFRYKGLDFRFGYNFLDSHRIGIIARYVTAHVSHAGGLLGAPGAGNGPLVPQRKMTEEPITEKYVALEYSGNINNTTLDASLYGRDIYTHINIHPDLRKPNITLDNYVLGPTVYGGKLIAKSPIYNFAATYGVDFFKENWVGREVSRLGGERKRETPNANQLNLATFGLLEYYFDSGMILSGSLRHDYLKLGLETSFIKNEEVKKLFEDAGDSINHKTTGGVGAILPLFDTDLSIIGNINTTFRAPGTEQIVSVGDALGRFTIPNPKLKPETGITYEAGLRYHDEKILSHLTFYVGEYKDLMVRKNLEYNGKPADQMQNIGKSTMRGIEFDFAAQILSELLFKTNITYTYGKDKISNKPLPQIMPLNGYLSLRYEPEYFAKSYLEYTNSWALKRTKVYANTERPRNGYDVSNIYFGKNFGKIVGLSNIALNFGIENLFNTKYSMSTVNEDIKYPVSKTNPLLNPGRNFKIGFKANF